MAKVAGRITLILGVVLFAASLLVDWVAGTTGADVLQFNSFREYFTNFTSNIGACSDASCYLLVLSPLLAFAGMILGFIGLFLRGLGILGSLMMLLVVGFFGYWYLFGAPTTVSIVEVGVGLWLAALAGVLALVGAAIIKDDED
ncbi:MAG: hypothetical protein Kow0069_17770 [Promethearchaeota archaeon]